MKLILATLLVLLIVQDPYDKVTWAIAGIGTLEILALSLVERQRGKW